MKKIIIIGGGIAGLSAGIFGRINGFETLIIEKNKNIGGECVGWYRQNHYIDGCIHWLVGTKENTPINDLWKTVGALENVEIYHPQEFIAFIYQGVTVKLYRDLETLQQEWTKLSLEDKNQIDEFCQDIKTLQKFEIPTGKPFDLLKLSEKIKFFLSMKEAGMIMSKYGKIDLKTYASRYHHPALKALFSNFLPEGYQASSIFFALASFTKGQASIPYGGSNDFSKRMEAKYLSLGGNLLLNSEVQKIEIESNQATSVILKDGQAINADYIIGACDAFHFYSNLLEGKYNDQAFEKRYNNPKIYPLASQIQISLSYQGNLDQYPRSQSFGIQPIPLLGRDLDRIVMVHYAHEKTFAPKDRTLITISINQFKEEVDLWFSLHRNKMEYQNFKNELVKKIITQIEIVFPEMKGKLMLLDVATPVTYNRYCNAYRGAFMGFLPTLKGKTLNHSGKIKKLSNVFLSGQWLQPPGGLPVALLTGKDTIMRICALEKTSFKSK